MNVGLNKLDNAFNMPTLIMVIDIDSIHECEEFRKTSFGGTYPFSQVENLTLTFPYSGQVTVTPGSFPEGVPTDEIQYKNFESLDRVYNSVTDYLMRMNGGDTFSVYNENTKSFEDVSPYPYDSDSVRIMCEDIMTTSSYQRSVKYDREAEGFSKDGWENREMLRQVLVDANKNGVEPSERIKRRFNELDSMTKHDFSALLENEMNRIRVNRVDGGGGFGDNSYQLR